jgi:lactate permease
MPLTLINWLLALAPVLAVLALMLGLGWKASRAGLVGWAAALMVAAAQFGAGPDVLGYAQLKGLLLTLDVLYIIWTALLLFHVADQAGAVSVIAERLPGLTGDRLMQALLLGWVFSSFLQGVGGFGVPIAVVAPLLVGLGFDPVSAVVMASIGHAWAVTFGSLASSFQALMASSGLPGPELAPPAALLLGISGLGCGAVVAHVQGGWSAVRRGLPALLILAAVMGVTQYALAVNRLWTLGATGAGFVGLIVGVGVARLPGYRTSGRPQEEQVEQTLTDHSSDRSLALALAAYGLLIILAFALNLIPPLDDLFNRAAISFEFPELTTSAGWVTPAGRGRRISVFGHGGAILLYTSLLAYAVYHRVGYYEPGAAGRIARATVKSALSSSLGILAMVGMAVTMAHAGMTFTLAQGLSAGVGPRAYPFVAPWIGTLGAFMTGSNTNSNVVFTTLQQQTATLLDLSIPLILAAQTTGGALGSVLAPAKVIVGCSTVGLTGQEGRALRASLPYGLALIAIVSGLIWLLAGMS